MKRGSKRGQTGWKVDAGARPAAEAYQTRTLRPRGPGARVRITTRMVRARYLDAEIARSWAQLLIALIWSSIVTDSGTVEEIIL